jgi:hypothetical protein
VRDERDRSGKEELEPDDLVERAERLKERAEELEEEEPEVERLEQTSREWLDAQEKFHWPPREPEPEESEGDD